jgi:zinc finger protein
MSEQKVNLFPSLGDIASRTNALANVEDDDKRLAHDAPTLEEQEDGEEREVQEIESLCMRCHEQVSYLHFSLKIADSREQQDCF